MDYGTLPYVIMTVCGIALVFLIIREILLWYWRVNEIVSLLKEIKKNTQREVHSVSKIEEQKEVKTEKKSWVDELGI